MLLRRLARASPTSISQLTRGLHTCLINQSTDIIKSVESNPEIKEADLNQRIAPSSSIPSSCLSEEEEITTDDEEGTEDEEDAVEEDEDGTEDAVENSVHYRKVLSVCLPTVFLPKELQAAVQTILSAHPRRKECIKDGQDLTSYLLNRIPVGCSWIAPSDSKKSDSKKLQIEGTYVVHLA